MIMRLQSLRRPELLGVYLNDHLAGSVGGVETARRARGSNEGGEFGDPLARLCEEIESDRESLEAVMEELGVSRSRIKPAIGWIGEKLGRLKPNGQRRRLPRPDRPRREPAGAGRKTAAPSGAAALTRVVVTRRLCPGALGYP